MTKSKSGLRSAIRYGLPVLLTVLWVAFIFSNSLRDGAESGEQSHRVVALLTEVAGAVGWKGIIRESAVRTAAHFLEFAVLGLLGSWIVFAFGGASISRSVLWLLLTVPCCGLVASVDELLQRLSEGRVTDVMDVLVDTAGAASAVLAVLVILLLLRLRRNRTGKRE